MNLPMSGQELHLKLKASINIFSLVTLPGQLVHSATDKHSARKVLSKQDENKPSWP